jgi:hypothetical protein
MVAQILQGLNKSLESDAEIIPEKTFAWRMIRIVVSRGKGSVGVFDQRNSRWG